MRGLQWWNDFLPYVRRAGLLQERAMTLVSGRKYVAISVSDSGNTFLSCDGQPFEIELVPKELRSKPKDPVPINLVATGFVVSVVNTPARSTRACGVVPATSDELYLKLIHVRRQWQRRVGLLTWHNPGSETVKIMKHWGIYSA
jgi:hypothetical protein